MIKKKITLDFPKSAAMNEFEIAVVNESSVFEPLKFYCIWGHSRNGKASSYKQRNTVCYSWVKCL